MESKSKPKIKNEKNIKLGSLCKHEVNFNIQSLCNVLAKSIIPTVYHRENLYLQTVMELIVTIDSSAFTQNVCKCHEIKCNVVF